MKLSKFNTKRRSNEGVEMELKDLATGKPAGAFITLRGRDGDMFREIRAERSKAMADRIASGITADLSQEEVDALTCDTLARLTVGWRELDGEEGPLEFSQQAAFQLYMEYPAIREQANQFVADRANFTLT